MGGADDGEEWSCASSRKGSAPTKKPHRGPGGAAFRSATGSTAFGASGSPSHPTSFKRSNYIPPVALEQLAPELTLEIYNFPAAWRTSDIRKLLTPFEGHYRLKWQNDTSCWIHFDAAETAARALDELQCAEASLRPFSPENICTLPVQGDAAPSRENTLEIYGFPPAWNATDLGRALEPWAGKYRLKWRTEASCWVIFEAGDLMEQALAQLSQEPLFKVRHYASPAV